MNAAERLKAIIRERQEWEAFGWGPILTAWAGVLAAQGLVELATGPTVVVGSAAYALGLVVQGALAALGGKRPGARQATLHGFWALVAVSAWFFGTMAPVVGGLGHTGAEVLELLFVALGLVVVGLIKERRELIVGAGTLALGALGLAFLPSLAPWRPLLIGATMGSGAIAAWVHDRKTRA